MAEKKETMTATKAEPKPEGKTPTITARPFDPSLILYPYMTEKAVRLTEKNKVVFVVSRSSGKLEIKNAIEGMYGVKVEKVNTVISPHGKKKAYVLLAKEFSASELASKLGML